MSEPVKQSRAKDPENLQEHIDKALKLRGEIGTPRIYKAAQLMFDPQLMHVDRIDTERPSVFVANHGPLGWEGSLIPSVIREHTGMFPRLLADGFLMKGKLEEPLMSLGLVMANRKVCSALMEAGESILVFPGGSREGAKRRGDQYKLLWEGQRFRKVFNFNFDLFVHHALLLSCLYYLGSMTRPSSLPLSRQSLRIFV